jgi:hypothetical protein
LVIVFNLLSKISNLSIPPVLPEHSLIFIPFGKVLEQNQTFRNKYLMKNENLIE